MGEETQKENGEVEAAPRGEAQADGASGSRLMRRKSIRDDITGVGDLVLLDPLREESLMANLRMRYGNDEIYVSDIK